MPLAIGGAGLGAGASTSTVPIPSGSNVDALPSLQALVDAAQALSAAGSPTTVYIPQQTQPSYVSGPIYLDGNNIEIRGDGAGTQIRGGFGYGGPPLVMGVPRLQKFGLNPATYRIPSVLGGGLMGISTKGVALLSVTAHPLQLGGYPTPSAQTPDYWQSPAYTLEFIIGPGAAGTWPDTLPLFGLGAASGGPWDVYAGTTMSEIGLFVRRASQAATQFDVFAIPTPGVWPRAITLQWDSATATLTAWVGDPGKNNGTQVAVTHFSTDGSTWKPGDTMAPSTGDSPFVFGGVFGEVPPPLEVHGFIASVGKKYDPTKTTETRLDGLPIPASRYWDRPAAGGPATTIAYLPMTDAAATHVAVCSNAGTGVGFWLANGGGASANLKLRDLALAGGMQQALAIGCCFGIELVGVTAGSYSLQGIGSIPYGDAYPIYMDRCTVGGFDCAYYGWSQLLWARDTVVTLTGRDGLRTSGGSFYWDGVLFGSSVSTAQTFLRQLGNAYGGSFTAKNVLIDNEGGGPSVAIIQVEQSPYCPNMVIIDNINISTLNAPAVYVHLIGHRTAASGNVYEVGKATLTNLQCYAGSTQPVLQVDGGVGEPDKGVGSWFGTCDNSSLLGVGVGAVANFVFPTFTHTAAP